MIVTVKKATLTLVGAVAFLMLIFSAGLPDADQCNDNADYAYYSTDNSHNSIKNQICTFHFTLFSISITSIMQEVLQMYSLGRKANRYRLVTLGIE